MNTLPFLFQGIVPTQADSERMLSMSRYLNHPKLREWIAMITLRRNSDHFPAELEMFENLTSIIDEIQDHDHIEALFTAERKINPALDRWMSEGFYSTYEIEDLSCYSPETVGGAYYRYIIDNGLRVRLMEWKAPETQLQFWNLRAGQTHDFEHIVCGGGFNYMGELVPYWFRLTNPFKHLHSQELAGELSAMSILGSLRYTVRTLLYYPQVWKTCVKTIQRGMRVGEESDAIFMAKYEDVFDRTIPDARAILGVRGVEEIDTAREGAIWAERAVA
jgi:ubiquinone biosynthesis protein COQ4